MSQYEVLAILFMVLSLGVSILILFKMGFSNISSNKFISLGVLIFGMVVMNVCSVLVQDFMSLVLFLVVLSFYSLFLIGYGYGVGLSLNLMMMMKMLADVLLVVFGGVCYLLKMESDLKLSVSVDGLNLVLEGFLIGVFSVYSLLGIFGFWVYWAMEASYFVSVYMHSCGFVATGLILFMKMSLSDPNLFSNLKGYLYIISLLSYLSFVFLFLTIKDLKKSFGYFSASSVCFLFVVGVISPTLSLVYFFMSSLIKMVIFEVMSFMGKTKEVGWWCLFWLFSIYLGNYSVVLMTPLLVGGDCFLSFFVWLMFFIKFYYLLVFLMKVWISPGSGEGSHSSYPEELTDLGNYFWAFQILFYFGFMGGLGDYIFLLLSKHSFFILFYMLLMQVFFYNKYLCVFIEGCKAPFEYFGVFIEDFKGSLKSFLESPMVLVVPEFWLGGVSLPNIFLEMYVFFVFIVVVWVFT